MKQRQYINVLRLIFAFSDLLLINICLYVCSHILNKYYSLNITITRNDLIISCLIWILSTRLFSLYNVYTLFKRKCVYRATWRSLFSYVTLFYLYNLFTLDAGNKSIFLLCFYVILSLCFILGRLSYILFEEILARSYDPNQIVSIFAIASIGGHWVQLLRLMPLFNFKEVTFISTNAGLQKTVAGHKYYSVPDANRNNKVSLIKCCLSISWVILFKRPEIIITTGAAPGLFGILIGRLLGIKTIWIDSIANVEKLSMSGNIALRLADRVYTQWPHLSTPKIIFAGNILEG